MIRFIVLLLGASAALLGGDPIVSLPKNYWIELETPVMRVVHVHYGPREKLPEHDHPKTPTLYVYLSDAGPVRFTHTGSDPFALERKPVQLGGLRLNAGMEETHEVENLGSVTSDFLRVEFKKLPLHSVTLRGRVAPSTTVLSGAPEVVFEDKNVRLVRLGVGGHQKIDLPSPLSLSAIDLVIRSGSSVLIGGDKKPLHSGQAWIAVPVAINNLGNEPVEFLRVEPKDVQ